MGMKNIAIGGALTALAIYILVASAYGLSF